MPEHERGLPSALPFALPQDLPLLRARLTLRLLADARLPAYKGGLFRGGFGYAFQHATCPQICWNAAQACAMDTICPYRWVFETPHPPEVQHLHDLRDVPRPFVLELADDQRTQYRAGDTVEFGLVLIGRGIDFLPYFLFGFAELGRQGLGAERAPARLERVEALEPWQAVGQVIYQDGQVVDTTRLPVLDGAAIAAHAAALPSDLRITIRTPLRLKVRGTWLTTIEPAALVRAVCWRLNALATFHGGGPWTQDYRNVVVEATGSVVTHQQVRWVDWERTSTHTGQRQQMQLGGIMGQAVVHHVSPAVRTALLAGSIVHAGKACVFGHGAYQLAAL